MAGLGRARQGSVWFGGVWYGEEGDVMRAKKAPKMPRGVRKGDDKMRISVLLDRQVFNDICAYGVSRGWTFSTACNDLLRCGILDLRDAEEFERAA